MIHVFRIYAYFSHFNKLFEPVTVKSQLLYDRLGYNILFYRPTSSKTLDLLAMAHVNQSVSQSARKLPFTESDQWFTIRYDTIRSDTIVGI